MCKITTAVNLFSIKQLKSYAFFPPGLFPHFSVSPQGIVSTQDLTSTQIWPLQYKTKRASQTRSPYAYSTHQCPHRILNTWTNLDAKTRWPHKSDLIAQRKLDPHKTQYIHSKFDMNKACWVTSIIGRFIQFIICLVPLLVHFLVPLV